MKRLIGAVLMMSLCCVPVLHAGIFGESEEEKEVRLAKHVADLLREPNKVIAQAQEAVENNDIEEGIRLFRKAQLMIEEIEMKEDTSGSSFATLRLKKFHCVSMLDALALRQSEVQDVRQAVTDTSELAARLAKERAELAAAAEQAENPNNLPRPPTLQEQLAVEEAKAMKARADVEHCRTALAIAQKDLDLVSAAFTNAAKAHTEADTKFFMAGQGVAQAKQAKKSPAVIEALEATLEAAKRELQEKKNELAQAKQNQAEVKARLDEAATLKREEAELIAAEKPVTVLRKAIADEAEAARKKAAEEKAKAEAEAQRMAAEQLRAKQAEAEAAAKAREAEAKAAAARNAEAKAKAEAEAKALEKEVKMCDELWRLKQVEAFERHVTEALVRWTDAPELLVQLARLRLIQGQEEDALELVAMISSKGEVGKKAAFVAAGAYMVKGLPLEAMKILEPAMTAFPNDPDVYYNMAVVLVRLPEIDPNREIASKYYIRSIELGGCRSTVLERRLGME